MIINGTEIGGQGLDNCGWDFLAKQSWSKWLNDVICFFYNFKYHSTTYKVFITIITILIIFIALRFIWRLIIGK